MSPFEGNPLCAMRTHRVIGDWLVYCADPAGSRLPLPRPLPTAAAEEELVRQSDLHGILPSFLRRFPFARAVSAGLILDANDRNRRNQTFSAILGHYGDAVMSAASGLPAVIVKGPVFARTLYPDRFLRGFTDIDILAAPDAVPTLNTILEGHGFTLAEPETADARGEWKWVHRINTAVMIEVQTNLVHAPAMRQAVSLRFEDIADSPERPAALLLVALVHAGVTHKYEMLRHMVDICLAARALTASADEQAFEFMLARTGASLSAVAGLEFAGRLFGEGRCLEIARSLKPVRYSGLIRRLLGRPVAVSTMSNRRGLHSWRRQIARELIKRGSGAAARPPAIASRTLNRQQPQGQRSLNDTDWSGQ